MNIKITTPIDPGHYHDRDGSGIHCHTAQKAMLGVNGFKAYMLGCALKYLWRHDKKNGKEDLKKAIRCIQFVIDHYDETEDVVTASL